MISLNERLHAIAFPPRINLRRDDNDAVSTSGFGAGPF